MAILSRLFPFICFRYFLPISHLFEYIPYLILEWCKKQNWLHICYHVMFSDSIMYDSVFFHLFAFVNSTRIIIECLGFVVEVFLTSGIGIQDE